MNTNSLIFYLICCTGYVAAAESMLYPREVPVEHVQAKSISHDDILEIDRIIAQRKEVTQRAKEQVDSSLEAETRAKLQDLPAKNKPVDIDHAMARIRRGKDVYDDVLAGNFYKAVRSRLPEFTGKNLKDMHDVTVLEFALTSSDAEFWATVQQDEVLQESVLAQNVPFSLEALHNPEYAMYIRSMYLRNNIKGTHTLQEYSTAYLDAIVDLQWYLYSKAMHQDRAFTSGMITFQDPDLKVFKFLDLYAELVSPKYKMYSGKSFHSLTAHRAYTRESSHWTGQRAFGDKNFGIDMKTETGEIVSILPGNKSHMLFGVRTNGMTFVKWEEFGTTVSSGLVHHTLRYFEKRNLEDNPELERREKVPTVVMEYFKKLLNTSLTKAQEADVQVHGISSMLNLLHADPAKVTKFKSFLVDHMDYQPDTLSLRKGGEIILHVHAKPLHDDPDL